MSSEYTLCVLVFDFSFFFVLVFVLVRDDNVEVLPDVLLEFANVDSLRAFRVVDCLRPYAPRLALRRRKQIFLLSGVSCVGTWSHVAVIDVVKAGAIIEVVTRSEHGWWDGILGEQRGWFPSNHVEIIAEDELEAGLDNSTDSGTPASELTAPETMVHC